MKRLAFALGLVLATACGDAPPAPKSPAEMVAAMNAAADALMARPEVQAPKVEVQHILISFAGAMPKPTVIRIRQDAERLAAELLDRLQAGADFDDLLEEHTDDEVPGIYIITLSAPEPGQWIRGEMIKAFGDVSWRLEPGEIGVAVYDQKRSPYGWHIVKRLN